MIPQIDNSIDDTNLINEVILPSRTYKLSSNYETQIKYGETQNAVGEELTLTDSAEVKLKKLDIKGNTKQDTTTGKNLLCKEWEYGSLGSGGTNINDGAIQYIRTKDYVTVEPNTTYMLSFHNTDIDFNRANIFLFNESKEADEEVLTFYYNANNNAWTFTTSSTDHYLKFTARKLGSGWNLSNIKFQIEKGSTATSYEPYTGGIASPNPEYPQEVKVVSGSNVINIENENLFPLILEVDGTQILQQRCNVIIQKDEFIFTATGADMYFGNVAIANSAYQKLQGKLIKIPANAQNIYLKVSNNAFSNNFICFFDENKVSLGYSNISTSKEVPGTAKYFTLRIGVSNSVSGTTYKTKVMVSTMNKAYIPHQGKELPLDLPVENLMALANSTNTDGGITRVIENGVIKLNGTPQSTSYNNTILTFTATKTGQYMLLPYKSSTNSNIRFIYKINDGSFINNDDNLTMNLTKNDVVTINLRISSTDRINNFTLKPMLYLGTKVNAFYPYGTDPIELCKIGDYQDYFYKSGSKWYLHKEIEKKVLNGSENWQLANSGTSNYYYYYNLGHTTIQSSSIASTHYPYAFISNSNTEQGILVLADGNIRIRYSTEDTVANFKTWLATNNVSVYYPLATATDTEITDPTLISQLDNLQKTRAYQGTTYISTIANEIGPILDIDYYPLSSIYYETAQVDRISGFIDDKDAIKQAVYHILSIERYSCLIYDDNYGVELQQYIGQDFEYLKVTIQKTLEEALMQDERIISIDVIDIEKIDNETANVKLSIQANVGEIQMEVNVNV